MNNRNRQSTFVGAAAVALLVCAGAAFGQEETVEVAEVVAETSEFALSADTAYIFNTLLFLVGGFLVMWMAAGFAMLEAGMVRSKNVAMQCTKNIALYSIAGLMFWLLGYNLMYDGVDGGFIGSLGWKVIPPAPDVIPVSDGKPESYSVASDWFFQMVFCATAASIVSGAVAERVKLWPFLLFVAIITGIIYPITGSWQWGHGWLYARGFSDFAGSTLVHSVGGWAALAGVLVIGARRGKYTANGGIMPIPGSSMPLATLGTFILWLGWFGFNGASQLAMGTIKDVSAVSIIFANTNTAAAAGVIAAMILTQLLYKKVDVTLALNGALGGLVAITAEPLMPTMLWAAIIGAIGGILVVVTVPLLDRMKLDDVVGAIPVHLVAGIWGTIAVPITNPATDFGTQALGIIAIGAFTFVVSLVVWLILKALFGVRVSVEDEINGLDKAEIGVEAYPDFAPNQTS